MNIRPSAIIIEQNKVLTLHYNYNAVDVYALPGGNLEKGEELKGALKRELFEELSIQIKVGEMRFLADVSRNEKNTLHVVFEANIEDGNIEINPDETTALDYCWLPLEYLNNFQLYPNISQAIIDSFALNKNVDPYLGIIDQKWH